MTTATNAPAPARSHRLAIAVGLGLLVVLVLLVGVLAFNSQQAEGRSDADRQIACIKRNLASHTTVDCRR